jgi:hypothetical protein
MREKFDPDQVIEFIKSLDQFDVIQSISYERTVHMMCSKYQHQCRNYTKCESNLFEEFQFGYNHFCKCLYPIKKHRVNTVPCDKQRGCLKCNRNVISNHGMCSCDIDNKYHSKNDYCLCDIAKWDLFTLKQKYIQWVEPSLGMDQMTKQYTKYQLTESLKTKNPIIVVKVPIVYKKQSISKALKMKVWDTYIGLTKGESLCVCCETNTINPFEFQCGHVIAESCGGTTTLDNLRPICSTCNQSMGVTNLYKFKKTLE